MHTPAYVLIYLSTYPSTTELWIWKGNQNLDQMMEHYNLYVTNYCADGHATLHSLSVNLWGGDVAIWGQAEDISMEGVLGAPYHSTRNQGCKVSIQLTSIGVACTVQNHISPAFKDDATHRGSKADLHETDDELLGNRVLWTQTMKLQISHKVARTLQSLIPLSHRVGRLYK